MRLPSLLLALPLAAATIQEIIQARDDENAGGAPSPVIKKFIVEAEPGISLADLSRKIEANGIKVLKTFDSDVFAGLSIETEHDNVDSLQEVTEVARAWPVNRFKLAAVNLSTFSHDAMAGNWSVHQATGVDKLHEAGLFGKGVKIGVIDSGIDYNHTALGGGIGPGFKVIGGYDLVGQNYNGKNAKVPDDDPMDTIGHGTHVAGIIAAKSEHNVGVAPEATLLAFKVFGAVDGLMRTHWLMQHSWRMRLVSTSLQQVWPVQRAFLTVHGPQSARELLTRALSLPLRPETTEKTDLFMQAAAALETTYWLSLQSKQLGYIPSVNRPLWNITGLPIVAITLNASVADDACKLPADTRDLSGAVVLIRKGTCNLYDKQDNLERFGARWILLYNNDDRPFSTVMTSTRKSQMVMIDAKTGATIIDAIKAGANVTVDFTVPKDDSWRVGFNDVARGIPSYTTSWGATNELQIKPDVAGPGGKIWSTAPGHKFAQMSGTSMATPYIAGVAALYISKFGGRSVHGSGFAKQLGDRIIASGTSVPWQIFEAVGLPKDFGFLAPVAQVGSGFINATKVLEYQTTLSFERFNLNDTNNFERYHKVDITNKGDKDVTYTFRLEPAGGFNAQGRTPGLLGDILDTRPSSVVPRVTFPSGTFRVRAGETKTAQFNFMYPDVADPSLLPVYSGKVIIEGSNGENLGIPYLGAAFDLKKSLRRNLFPASYPFAFNTSRAAQDFPKVYARFRWGVKELRWDIYETNYQEKNWKYPPVVGQNGYIGSATFSPYASSFSNFDPATMDKNRVLPFPVGDIERTTSWDEATERFWWLGKLANGTDIAPGNYTMRFAARLPFSNPDHSDNWQIWDTPKIQVRPLQ
ncbi:Minor extracellular protease vpr like protein [Verticillium longisporum]|uniref:Minor extracellular protease vpr like protein n=1 Tax=Verticillium longisporum TaxID=100787 RepID=A0A8I2ZEF9_VERLO|nr:Minor extracellular protease vpr like protein [Verticillium longisporum]